MKGRYEMEKKQPELAIADYSHFNKSGSILRRAIKKHKNILIMADTIMLEDDKAISTHFSLLISRNFDADAVSNLVNAQFGKVAYKHNTAIFMWFPLDNIANANGYEQGVLLSDSTKAYALQNILKKIGAAKIPSLMKKIQQITNSLNVRDAA